MIESPIIRLSDYWARAELLCALKICVCDDTESDVNVK